MLQLSKRKLFMNSTKCSTKTTPLLSLKVKSSKFNNLTPFFTIKSILKLSSKFKATTDSKKCLNKLSKQGKTTGIVIVLSKNQQKRKPTMLTICSSSKSLSSPHQMAFLSSRKKKKKYYWATQSTFTSLILIFAINFLHKMQKSLTTISKLGRFCRIGLLSLKYTLTFVITTTSQKLFSRNYQQVQFFLNFNLKKGSEEFQKFNLALNKESNLRFLGWQGFYVKPVQRVPKYVLLLNDFCKHLEKDHPLSELYSNSYRNFEKVLEENNASMSTLTQLIKLFELQKDYGNLNQLTILDSKRFFISEERAAILQDNQEKQVHLYILSDMLLICEPDVKQETGYRYLKHLIINERSQCQNIPNKRYFSNLTRVIGKNLSITFISETPEFKDLLFKSLRKVIISLKNKTLEINDKACKYEIEVSVIGTQERMSNFQKYTVYIIDVRIDNIYSQIVVRYSEIKKLQEFIVKQFPEIVLPFFHRALWLGNHDPKVIEQRKQEIEDFILCLLSNEEFQNKIAPTKDMILQALGLDTNFYQLPDFRKSQIQTELTNRTKSNFNSEEQSRRLSQITEDRVSSTQLLRSSDLSMQDQQFSTGNRESENFTVTVLFHNQMKSDYEIPTWFRGYDFVRFIASQINLQECCDFRLYETDKNLEKFQPLIDDEIIFQFLNKGKSQNRWYRKYQPKPFVLFRKYLQLSPKHETYLIEFDIMRLQLIVGQAYYDIQKGNLIFETSNYSRFAAHSLVIHSANIKVKKDVNWDLIKCVVPGFILKKESKLNWVNNIFSVYNEYKGKHLKMLNEEQLNELLKNSKQLADEKSLKNLIANMIFLAEVKKHPFFGMSIFEVGVSNKEIQNIAIYVKKKLNRNIVKEGFAISVSHSQFHLIDKLKTQIYMSFQFSDFDELRAHNDLLCVWLEERQVQFSFETELGFQIVKMITEYEYLEMELQKLEE